jgi:hypothetical protein
MSVTAIVNASMQLSGSAIGPEQIVIPPIQATNALDIRVTAQLSAGFTTLTSILGGGVTLTGASGMWIIPNGSTASVIQWGGATSLSAIATAPNPALVTAGITISGAGVCLTVATTASLIIF